MLNRILTGTLLALLASSIAIGQQRAAGNLRIVVIAGEGAVNIIQQKTAVAPIIEVRDRNNLPVAGATVTFSVGGSGASFGTGSTLTVVTNAAGQATAAGLTPTAAGAVQINVTAAMQGQLASAAITQTNFATAQAAAAAGSGGGAASSGGAAGGGGGASGGGAAGAGAGAGGGISATTIGIVGAAVAGGGALVATQTDLLKKAAFITLKGQVFSTIRFGGVCTVPAGAGDSPLECYGPPVGGAVVSTTLDSKTATTDGAGNFDLLTTIPEKDGDCRTFTITITATGHPIYTVNTRGTPSSNSDSRQKFSLSPATPSSMGSGC